MNLEKLMIWIAGVVIAFAVTGNLNVLQAWIWKAQAKVIYEARSRIGAVLDFFHQQRTLIILKRRLSNRAT